MDAAGSCPPMTFEIDGEQYVFVVGIGGKFHNFKDRASKYYAFKLP